MTLVSLVCIFLKEIEKSLRNNKKNKKKPKKYQKKLHQFTYLVRNKTDFCRRQQKEP